MAPSFPKSDDYIIDEQMFVVKPLFDLLGILVHCSIHATVMAPRNGRLQAKQSAINYSLILFRSSKIVRSETF